MLDDFKTEQPIIYKVLSNSINKDKISHAYLLEFNGYQKGVDFAIAMAKALLCPYKYKNNSLCKNCSQCHAIDNDNFIELKIIEADGQWIKKEQLEELQREFSKKALIGNRKIYIIKDAEKLNIASSNSILKFLEEPSEGIIAILTTKNIYQVLETIKSRCQLLSLKPYIENLNADTKTILANLTFNNKEETNAFLADLGADDKIKMVIDYVNFLEKNKFKTIIYKNKNFIEMFNDKKQLEMAFNWLILYYKDILNYKLKHKLYYFVEEKNNIDALSTKLSLTKICQKIEILVELSTKIKFNINNNMLMDKLVIKLGEE